MELQTYTVEFPSTCSSSVIGGFAQVFICRNNYYFCNAVFIYHAFQKVLIQYKNTNTNTPMYNTLALYIVWELVNL